MRPARAHSPSLLLAVAVAACAAFGCRYGKLLRPNVLKQLDPEVVDLLNELPAVDRPNEEMVARLFAHGGLSHAEAGKDGTLHDEIRVPAGQFIWKPAIIVMPRGGTLELDISNEDPYSHHAALLPSNGDRQSIVLPVHTRGRARLQLDQPGLYWFGCPVANHAGRGMLGLIIVKGEVPESARLDRPKQERP
jgi:PQQ system protein